MLAVYLFGSRADDGLRVLAGGEVDGAGSDLDVGVIGLDPDVSIRTLAWLDIGFADILAPLRVDLVPLQRVDAIFQARAIDGHRIYAADSTCADLHELLILRRAADLLPLQRELERELFGLSTS
ncbi:MAG TPA: nucleotidyltransferase domain-containing protein [Thermoanaerobaculia bacterium]